MDSNTVVLVWVACAIAGLLLAEHRNRGKVEGFLLGLICGPLGLLVMLAWPGKPSSPPDRTSR